jgi:exopolysaccharide biosynthesis polyprenyl glycosylphosphotransferase
LGQVHHGMIPSGCLTASTPTVVRLWLFVPSRLVVGTTGLDAVPRHTIEPGVRAGVQSTRVLDRPGYETLHATRLGRTGAAHASWPLIRVTAEVFTDSLLAWLAFWLAWLLRYQAEVGGRILPADEEPFATFHGKASLFAGALLLVLLIRGVYRLPRSAGLLDEATLLTGGITTAMAGVILWAFFLRFAPSRLVFMYAWVGAIALLLARRVVTRACRRWLWSRGHFVDRVLIVGATPAGQRVIQAMTARPALGYRVVGFADEAGDAQRGSLRTATEHRVVETNWLGQFDQVGQLVEDHDVDEVIIALSSADQDQVLDIVNQCRARDVSFKVVPDLFQLALDRVDLGEVAGIPLIGIRGASITGRSYQVKRAIDLALTLLLLSIMAVPMAIIALLIRHDSPGPVFVSQRRIGRDGRPFPLLKFRTMVDGAERLRADLMASHVGGGGADPRLFKVPNDPRLTRVGRHLRRLSLDELPQLIHVLRGEMSVVGPRPPLPEEVEGYEEWHRQRLMVTPGLTGLWQVNGRSHLSFDEMVRLDLYYAEHWSPWLDIKIVLRTIPAVLTGNGAY